MLEEYKNFEPIIYKQMLRALDNNLSHAYLFDLNNNVYAENMVLSFIKAILCGMHKSKEEYENCIKCRRIDDGNYQELEHIYPDGQFIKKEQLDMLQKKFSTKSIESDKRIYIIHDADKLNSYAANSLLKFLEEPSEGVIGILLTNNSKNVMNTIISRCQVLKFENNNVEDFIKYNKIVDKLTAHKIGFSIFLKTEIDEYIENFINSSVDFWNLFEKSDTKMLIYEKQYFLDIFKEKEEIIKFIKISILFYVDILNIKLNRKVIYFDDYLDSLNNIAMKNSVEDILNKLNVLFEKEKMSNRNVNTNMFLDGIIIDMEGSNGKCSWN